MPAPRWVARMNKRVTNRLLWPVVRWLPGFAMVVHTGVKTGNRYRTPIMVFGAPGKFVIALTYGPTTQWVRNVEAAGWCVIEFRSGPVRVHGPQVIHDRSRSGVPRLVRIPLRLMRVEHFLELRAWPVQQG